MLKSINIATKLICIIIKKVKAVKRQITYFKSLIHRLLQVIVGAKVVYGFLSIKTKSLLVCLIDENSITKYERV